MSRRRRQHNAPAEIVAPNGAPVVTDPLASDFQLNMRFGGETPQGQPFALTFTMPGTDFQHLYDLIRKIGVQGMRDILYFFSELQRQAFEQGRLHPQAVAGQVLEHLSKMDYPEPDPDPSNAEDKVLAFTYALLRRRIIKPEQAAQYASAVLGEDISTPAWRKRLYRWADNRKIPQIEQRQARKSKKSTKPGKLPNAGLTRRKS